MSNCKYKEIAKVLNKEELSNYYKNHLSSDVCNKFDIPSPYLLKQILKFFDIPQHTPAENTKIQFENMSSTEKLERGRKISESNMGREIPQEVRNKISISQIGIPKITKKENPTRFKPGAIPWNKGKVGVQKWVDGQRERRYNTMKVNKSFNKSSVEEKMFVDLCDKYGENDVYRQYSDERYPFACDFYIPSEDLFIELNAHWTHGPHPFNELDCEDIKLLTLWKSKATETNMYAVAIDVWTRRDVLKQRVAKENNLNYLAIY